MSGLKLQPNESPQNPAGGGPPPLPAGGSDAPAVAPQAPSSSPPPPSSSGPSYRNPPPAAPPPDPVKKGVAGKLVIGILLVALLAGGGYFGWDWYSSQSRDGALESSGDGTAQTTQDQPGIAASVASRFAPSPDSVEWPVIVLTGMAAGAESDSTTAILNGAVVYLNQRISGAELVEVHDDGVVLEFQNTRKFVRIGEST